MRAKLGAYPPPEGEDDDDTIAEQFLDDLRVRLENAGDYGTAPWRAERDEQMHRLAGLGWSDTDLAAYYRVGRETVRASIARHHGRTGDDLAHAGGDFDEGRWSVRIPAYSLDLNVDRDSATALHALASDHGLAVHVNRLEHTRSR